MYMICIGLHASFAIYKWIRFRLHFSFYLFWCHHVTLYIPEQPVGSKSFMKPQIVKRNGKYKPETSSDWLYDVTPASRDYYLCFYVDSDFRDKLTRDCKKKENTIYSLENIQEFLAFLDNNKLSTFSLTIESFVCEIAFDLKYYPGGLCLKSITRCSRFLCHARTVHAL